MSSHVIIPFRPQNPKKRLSHILTESERKVFARTMLSDVTSTVRACNLPITILSTEIYDFPNEEVVVREDGLNESLNWLLPQYNEPVLIIMADLPLITKESLQKIYSTSCDIAIVPGLGGGTNILYIRNPKKFQVKYYGNSFKNHLEIAQKYQLTVEIIDSMRMSTDIDEPTDLVELMIHGSGNAKAWLLQHDFSLSTESGRLKILHRGHDIVSK